MSLLVTDPPEQVGRWARGGDFTSGRHPMQPFRAAGIRRWPASANRPAGAGRMTSAGKMAALATALPSGGAGSGGTSGPQAGSSPPGIPTNGRLPFLIDAPLKKWHNDTGVMCRCNRQRSHSVSSNYHRAQILLEPEQHRRLKQIAERQGRSISDVTRGIVSAGLEAMAAQEEAHAARWTQVEQRLRVIREGAQARKGIYQGDLVGEIRAGRDEDLDAARGSSS